MADLAHPPTESLQDALDGRLPADARAALEAHLAGCARCRGEVDALAWTKRLVAESAVATAPPPGLDDDLLRLLDAEDAASVPSAPARRVGRPARWPAWLAAAAVLAVLVWTWGRPAPAALPVQVAADFRAFAGGTLALEYRTTEPAVLEARLSQSGLNFPARVFDFGMMQFTLTGGGRHHVGGHPSALFAYEGPNDLDVLCQMYQGTLAGLPPPDDRRTAKGIEFLVYRQGEVSVIFWQEGEVVCVLAANGDAEAAFALAATKAVRV
jgi:hypothetical protein